MTRDRWRSSHAVIINGLGPEGVKITPRSSSNWRVYSALAWPVSHAIHLNWDRNPPNHRVRPLVWRVAR